MPETSIRASEAGLPFDVAASFDPALRAALDNPLRRQILRILIGAKRALSVRQIANELDASSISEVAYHALVLEKAGAMIHIESAAKSLYRSGVEGNKRALSALETTRHLDHSLLSQRDDQERGR